MIFGEKLKLLRSEKHLTQEELAEKLSVSRQAVSKWESGAGYPETEKMMVLSKMFNVSLDYLLLDDEYVEEQKESLPKDVARSCIGKIAIYLSDTHKSLRRFHFFSGFTSILLSTLTASPFYCCSNRIASTLISPSPL